MSNALDAINGANDQGVNWSGRFHVKVNSQSITGLVTFRASLRVDEEDIGDAGEPMPIGKSLNSRSISYSISIRNLSGGNADNPEVLAGNFALAVAALGNEQFQLEVIERNMKIGRSDWMFKSVVLRGCTVKGDITLADVTERGGPPVISFAGSALGARVQIGSRIYDFSGLA